MMKVIKIKTLLIILMGIAGTTFAQTTPKLGNKEIKAVITQKYSELRTWKYALPNGVRLVVRPDDSVSLIQIRAVSPGGALLFPSSDFAAATHAGEMVGAAILSKMKAGTHITIVPQITPQFSTLNVSCPQEELEKALQLITQCFTAPEKDSKVFKEYLQQLKKIAELNSKDPSVIITDQLAAISGYPDGNSLKAVVAIDPDRAYEIFKTAFGNAANFSFVFTGKLKESTAMNTSKLLPLISSYIGALPSKKDLAGELYANGFHKDNLTAEGTAILQVKTPELPLGKVVKNVYYGRSSTALVRLLYHGQYLYSDSADLQLRVLSSLLEEQLTSGSHLKNLKLDIVTGKYPAENYQVIISYQCDVKEVENRVKNIQEQILNLQAHIDPEAIKRYVTAQKVLLKKQYFDNAFWTDFFIEKLKKQEDPYEFAHYPFYFRKATPATVQYAAKEFLSDKNYIKIVLLPAKMKNK